MRLSAGVKGARPRSLAWAGYAASGWAIAYAIGVRGYQGLGGTLGLAGTFEDAAAMRRASLIAGLGILLVVTWARSCASGATGASGRAGRADDAAAARGF